MDRKDKNRLRGIMAGLFCVGVLTGGIGTGVAFADFSRFTYALVQADEGAFQTETFTYKIEQEDGERIWIRDYLGGERCYVKADGQISQGTVEIRVVYDAGRCSPVMTPRKDQEDERILDLYLEVYDSDLGNFMAVKDQFLEGLKDGQWREYQSEYVKSVECHVNPADVDKMRLY